MDFGNVLQIVLNWLSRFFEGVTAAPQIIWQWSAGKTPWRAIVIAAAVLIAVSLVAAVVSTIRTLIKKKKFDCFAFFFLAILYSVGLWIAQGQIVSHTLPEGEIIRLGDEEAVAYGQYSLARGTMESEPVVYVSPIWFFADEVFSYRVSNNAVIQLPGMLSVGNNTFHWDHVFRETDYARLEASCAYSENKGESTYISLKFLYYPNVQMSEEGWFLDAGETAEAETAHLGDTTAVNYTVEILENTEDRVIVLARSPEIEEERVCLAQQEGPDLLVAVVSSHKSTFDENGQSLEEDYSFLSDIERRDPLVKLLVDLFDEKVRLFRDLTEEQLKTILPDRIVDYPIGLSVGKHFSIPCRDLIEMNHVRFPWNSRYSTDVIRFVGAGPDGKDYQYSLYNFDIMNVNAYEVTEKDWDFFDSFDAAYRDTQATSDPVISEFIGVKAVNYHNGWLILMGNDNANGKEKQYYYLSMEPVDG